MSEANKHFSVTRAASMNRRGASSHFLSGRFVTVVTTCLLALASQDLFAARLHVATNGRDTNPGTKAKPFATLERARDEVRRLKASGSLPSDGITVEVRAGVYELSRPLELTDQDSGRAGAPVVYQARKGDSVRLMGGRVVTGWTPVTDPAVRARLEEKARDQVRQADLRTLGIKDLGDVVARGKRLELFFQDQPMTVARWPNSGFITITDVRGPTEVDIRGTKGRKEGLFTYDGDRPNRWGAEPDIWVHGYWFWDWAEQRHPVASVDTAKHLITVKPPYHSYGYRKGQWFYAFNLLAELDRPGEWYLDRRTGILYFWPPAPLEHGQAVVSVIPTLVQMRNASYVTIRGLVLEACRATAIEMSGGRGNLIAGCTIRNTGQEAVNVTGQDSGVVGCDIAETAGGGITLNGGDRASLTPAKLYADNNHIHHFSRWDRVYQPGISLGGVGNRATHNLIDNAPHMAIGFSGNDHLIEFNEIHSVCYESNDAGAIYAGRDWTMRGTRIRNNYFHHISGFAQRGCVGVYLDDQFSGTEITGNVFYKVTRAAMIGGGRDCTIANNIFVDCMPATHVDARGLGWAAGGFEGLKDSLNAVPSKRPPWSTRYPKLVTLLDEQPMSPVGNVLTRNICVRGRWGDFESKAKPLITFRDNLLDQDPLFVDAARQNFQLRDDSPAFKLGFERIPLERIGLYRDKLRASWPVTHFVRPDTADSASAPAPTGT
jgi:hypothetical protein